MRLRRLCWYLATVCALSAAPPKALETLEIKSIDLAELTTDRVRFKLHLGGIARHDLTIRTLAFDNVSVNGIPVFLPSRAGRFRISKGKPFDEAGALHATVFFRDLESLQPLRRMIREQKAHVRATIRVQPELNLLQMVMLRASGVWLSAKWERPVPVELPGGALSRSTALVALAAADRVWVLGRNGLEWRQQRNAFLQQVRAKYASRVLAIESRYELRTKDGQRTILRWQGLGFRLNKRQLLTPAEAVEPWMFESSVAAAIASKDAQVVSETLEIMAGSRYSLQKGNLKIVSVPQDHAKAISIDRKKIYNMRERNSTSNVALLEIGDFTEGESEMKDAPLDGSMSSVAVFRLRSSGAPPEILIVLATRDDDRFRLGDPIDSRAIGSPVIAPEGLVGMLQDQTVIAPMRELREKLNHGR